LDDTYYRAKCYTHCGNYRRCRSDIDHLTITRIDRSIYVKAEIDEYNKRVNLDLVLFVAQIKRSIYGKAGFEIVLDPYDYFPGRLIPLRSTSLKPNVNKNWELTGFQYEGKDGFYEPGEVLYFTNLGLEADYEGLSDIEGIIDICKARHETLGKDIPEIVMSLWAPFLLLQADTSGLSKEEADKALDALVEMTKPGKRVVVNESVQGQVIDMKPDVPGLTSLLDKFEDRIIGNFQTPRFLVGKPIENRATAYAELEAYVEGPISSTQRYFKREVERQWYDPLTDQVVMKEERLPHSAISSLRKAQKNIPVVLKHRWNPVRVFDIYQLADAVAKLWGSHAMGPIGDHREKVWDLMGWDPAELEEEEK